LIGLEDAWKRNCSTDLPIKKKIVRTSIRERLMEMEIAASISKYAPQD
jgi:hypothetical protein